MEGNSPTQKVKQNNGIRKLHKMKTIEFYLTLPSGQQLLDVIEWEEGYRDIVFYEGAIYQHLLKTGKVLEGDGYVKTSEAIEDVIQSLEVLALPRNEEDEVVSRVIIQL